MRKLFLICQIYIYLELVNPNDPTLEFMHQMHTEALLCAQVSEKEYFLCFRGKSFLVRYIDLVKTKEM